ncbi:MAG TPA: BTAD domain-containing putative transcriptional regulator [Baekduia sp.]|nr:BTAD domain-containing putative transcriptional regulator [Baekduia sp.]
MAPAVDGATLRIRLLGGFSVEIGGVAVPDTAWRLRKARAIVKVAALASNRRVHRDVVCELLWPDRDARAAANNLHQALHAARRALGDAALLPLADDVLALTADAWVDVDAFEAAARAGDPDAALALYAGELLPEDRFADWAAARRAALEEQWLDLCARAADGRLAAGDAAGAVRLLGPAATGSPLHEPTRRALMRALAAAGRRQDALTEFEALRHALREQTGADPDPQTRALYRELLQGAAPAPALRRSPAPRDGPRPGALPVPLTSFVGRERELAELHRVLDRDRLVTLTGPGGAGKTRLAIELATARAARAGLPDGAWFADLGALADGQLVPQAVATALGVPIPANRPALDALVAHAGALRGALLVLDTCEHLLSACAALCEALLAAGAGIRILATSREPLRCAAEVAWRVPSLVEAPRLFRERAAAVRARTTAGDGAWSMDEEQAIEAICWRLERMPLAVELAAAQTGGLTVAQIAARLDGALDVLGSGARTALTRQQTLRATLDWSHDLLTAGERTVYRRLATFAGAFTLEAAEAVVAGVDVEARHVAALLARLVDKSLVVAERGRFRLSDPIRQHGAEHLVAAGEDVAVRRRHLRWCLELAQAHDPLRAGGDDEPLAVLEAHHDDLRAALGFALRAEPATALLLATHLWRFWLARSWFVEGTRWMDAVLAAAPDPTRPRVEALLAAAGLALRRGDADGYLRRVGEAGEVYRLIGDPAARAEALQQHAIFEEYVRSSERSARLFDAAIAAAEELGAQRVAASAVHASALTPWSRSDPPGTRRRLADAIERLRALDPGDEPFLQEVTLGMVVLPEGAGGAPRLIWEATVFGFRRLDRDRGLALALGNLARVARAQGAFDEAAVVLEEALARSRAAGDATGEALALVHRGHLARSRGEPGAALDDLEEGAARLRALGEHRDAAVATLGVALARGAAGDLSGARAELERTLASFLATDDLPAIGGARVDWGLLEERAGDLERARALYAGSVDAWRAQRVERFAGWAGLGLGAMLQRLGEHHGAEAALRGAHASLRHAADDPGAREAERLLGDQAVLSGGKEART